VEGNIPFQDIQGEVGCCDDDFGRAGAAVVLTRCARNVSILAVQIIFLVP